MQQKNLIIIPFLILGSTLCAQVGGKLFAQEFKDSLETGTNQGKFWKNIKVRKAFETMTEDDDKAANLTFTFPKGKKSSFVINAGIGYEFGDIIKKRKNNKLYKHNFSGFFVYNQNNQVDKEQKNYKTGMTFTQVFFNNAESVKALFGEYALEYLHDYYDTAHSVVFTSYWHLLSKKPNSIKLGGYAQTAKPILFYLQTQAGVEYQNIFDSKTAAEKGYDLRGFFNLGGNLLFKKKTFDPTTKKAIEKEYWTKGIELKLSYEGRVDIANNVQGTESYIPLFKGELLFYPTQNNKFAIGVSYNNGANPIDGTAKQTFWLLSFKYKK